MNPKPKEAKEAKERNPYQESELNDDPMLDLLARASYSVCLEAFHTLRQAFIDPSLKVELILNEQDKLYHFLRFLTLSERKELISVLEAYYPPPISLPRKKPTLSSEGLF